MDISLSDKLSLASSLLGYMTYPAADAVVTISAVYLIMQDRRTLPAQLASPYSHFATALLVVLAASQYTGWTRTLYQVVSFALPLLATHPSGYTLFQVANALGIYRMLSNNGNPLTSALCIVLHTYLVLANLDPSSQAHLKSIMLDISFAQVRQLKALVKLRTLSLDDLWPLPERFQLRNAYAELTINTDESLFLVRAVSRMIWKPMIPIHIAGMLFQLLPIFKTILTGCIYHCLDSSDNSTYYKAYLAAAGLILIQLLAAQVEHLNGYINDEKSRVQDALELELTRRPLIHSGLKKVPNREYTEVDDLINSAFKLQDAIPHVFGAFATVLPIYSLVGWYAFIPPVVSLVVTAFEHALKHFVGGSEYWDHTNVRRPGDSINEMYFNIKTVKLFGWERMYLDPKLRMKDEYLKKLPWYASLVRFGFTMMDIVSILMADLTMYLTVALYLKTMPASDSVMTNSKLLEMTEHIENLRNCISDIAHGIAGVADLVRHNNTLEPRFRCETFTTISHERLDESNQMQSITMDNCSFRWGMKDNILKQVNFNATAGELVAVVGKTGSGKTSLLLALCRELEMTKGSGKVVGRIGYMEQSPWIMNDTLRANILFGREFDEEYFWKVIHACALTQDLKSWPDGDLTMIGERGINISGGQRARLALARTVYSQADVYILDDPLSAVDAHVKRHILDNVILGSGLLGNKLCVVTTHSESMLPFCNQIVTVRDKTVTVVCQEPKEHLFVAPAATTTDLDNICDSMSAEIESDNTADDPANDGNTQSNTTLEAQGNSIESVNDLLPPQKRTLMDNARYVLNVCGWKVIITVIISASIHPIARFIFDGYNIAALKENAKSNTISHDAVLWYLMINVLRTGTIEILRLLEDRVNSSSSKDRIAAAIQDRFAHSLIHAPLPLVEKIDRFKILSAYDNGSRTMAYFIPLLLRWEVIRVFQSVLCIWRSALTSPQLMIIVPIIIWVRRMIGSFDSSVEDSLSDISNEVNSGHSQTSSIIEDGSFMIRMFGVEPYYISRYMSGKDEEKNIDKSVKTLRLLSDMISNELFRCGCLLSTISGLMQSHLTMHRISSSQLKMLQDDVGSLTHSITMLIGVSSRFKRHSNTISTFCQFSDIEPEAPYIVDDCRVPSEWPHSGNVEFKNLSVKYGTDQDYALKSLNVSIRSGEKIGIVGRTGAGKSTLAKAIFRLLNKNIEGSIEIDGHDTATFGVGDFRPKLGIIPQESTMFRGTVRRNLDPLNEFTIEDMWAAMIKCGVAELIDPDRKCKHAKLAGKIVDSDDGIDDIPEDDDKAYWERERKQRWVRSGLLVCAVLFMFDRKWGSYEVEENTRIGINGHLNTNASGFSSGQQQLFSLCRLLMRKRKVMILDEATADVDLETDRKMQELIRTEFSECTVLTIAHRLDTIMSSDRIIVMEKGEIVEIGPPQELIAKGGMFAKLVQANEF